MNYFRPTLKVPLSNCELDYEFRIASTQSKEEESEMKSIELNSWIWSVGEMKYPRHHTWADSISSHSTYTTPRTLSQTIISIQLFSPKTLACVHQSGGRIYFRMESISKRKLIELTCHDIIIIHHQLWLLFSFETTLANINWKHNRNIARDRKKIGRVLSLNNLQCLIIWNAHVFRNGIYCRWKIQSRVD